VSGPEVPLASSTFLVGLALGARHACEPDHVAALSMLAQRGATVAQAAMQSLRWALGHSLAIACLIFMAPLIGWQATRALSNGSEIFVAILLIALGAVTVEQARRERRHGTPAGATPGTHWRGSTGLGLVQGLAGSAPWIALYLAGRASWVDAASIGAGFVAAIAGIGLLLGLMLIRAHRASRMRFIVLRAAAGVATLGAGSHLLARSLA